MLSYTWSVIVVIALLFLAILWVLGCPSPKGYKAIGLLLRPLRMLNRQMVSRKGILWTGLTWWSLAAVVACLITVYGDYTWSTKVKVSAVSCFPPLVGWGVRRSLHRRRERRYRLPRRR